MKARALIVKSGFNINKWNVLLTHSVIGSLIILGEIMNCNQGLPSCFQTVVCGLIVIAECHYLNYM